MFTEFKKFILRGNVVDLAVAVVIGAAFTAVVTAFVSDFLTPLIAAIQGNRDFASYAFNLHGVKFAYGHFLNTLISFLLTATAVFFGVVQPINRLAAASKRSAAAADKQAAASAKDTARQCPDCLSDIPAAARRCKFCTSIVQT